MLLVKPVLQDLLVILVHMGIKVTRVLKGCRGFKGIRGYRGYKDQRVIKDKDL